MDRIAATFHHHPNARQIKKLVLAACTGTWENDPQHLAAFDFATLLGELTQRYPTLADVKERLYRIVDALNKKEEYRGIAGQILDQLEPQYLQQDLMGFQDNNEPDLELPESECPTEPFAQQTTKRPPASKPAHTPATPPQDSIVGSHAHYLAPELLNLNGLGGIFSTSPESSKDLSQPENWFDIRWEIMKFANPLSVKILLFSVVEYPFGFNNSDWLKLHDVTLDQLLAQLVDSHKSLAKIEASLMEMSIFLDQAMPAVHTAPHIGTTVSAILQALQPLTKLVSPVKPKVPG